jgi:hypothetical protein
LLIHRGDKHEIRNTAPSHCGRSTCTSHLRTPRKGGNYRLGSYEEDGRKGMTMDKMVRGEHPQ